MFDHTHYVPILKCKRGEQKALEKLNMSHKAGMTPLIEIQPVPYDHQKSDFKKTVDEHLKDVGTQVKDSWNQNRPIFVEVNTLYDNEDFDEQTLQNGQHPVEFVIDSIESNGTPAIPVTGIYRYQQFHDAIKKVIKKYKRGVCLRLDDSDLSDLNSLNADINTVLDFLEIIPEEVDIILDYKYISHKQKNHLLSSTILTIGEPLSNK
ncbi:hypothetical protein P4S93_18100, partial [Aneurinibacillus thermoaerophilus]|uniref:beta family protein n=1 Tax=Aneurinibacillus thermoaerophilus TaxID=143495 RepID=UPI002E1E647C|nr:hypothetical protein [Aneurinibacillus thermoaerophilus]MED0762633.1 hypothetical protein [Aneurinibacillus thermoaerophilus]